MSYDIESSIDQNDLTYEELDEMIFNKLFCTHKRKRVILWYSMVPSDWHNYAMQTYRTEICANCGKIKTERTGKYEETFSDMFNYKKMLLESQGYISENDYVYELDRLIEELGFAEE